MPWLDLSKQSASDEASATGFFLEKPKMEWYTHHYLPTSTRGRPRCSATSPTSVRAILVAGFDPLRDE